MSRTDLLGIPKRPQAYSGANVNARPGELAITASIGAGTTGTSSTPFDVAGLLVTIVTTGGPVLVGLTGADTGNAAQFFGDNNGSGSQFAATAYILRNGNIIAVYQLDCTATTEIAVPASSIVAVDLPGPGTHTYKIQLSAQGAAAVKHAKLCFCALYAKELM